MNNKGISNMAIILTLVAFAGMFVVMFQFISDNAIESNITVPSSYNNLTENYTKAQDDVGYLINNFTSVAQDLQEPEIGEFFTGIAAGTLALFKLPLELVDLGEQTFELTTSLFPFISPRVKTTFAIIVSVLIVFAVIRFITQRGNDA